MRLAKLVVITSLIVFVVMDLHAQTPGTLSVRVRDALTEEAVAQAEVSLATFGGGTQSHRGFTDKTGNV